MAFMLFFCQLLLNFQGAYTLIQVRSLSNNRLNTQELNHPSINQEDAMDRIDIYADIVKSNIDYEYLLHENPCKKRCLKKF